MALIPDDPDKDPMMEGTEPAPDDQADTAAPIDPAAEDAAPAPPSDYEAMPNLVSTLPLSFLRRVASRVLTDAESDYKSTEEHRRITAEHVKLYYGTAADNIPDQKNLTVVALPYTKRAVKMFHSKMFPQLYPASKELMTIAIGSSDPELIDRAERCSDHMNQQLYRQIPEYIPSHDRGMKQNLIEGTIYEVWYFDYIENRPTQEICLAEDVWIPYKHKSDRPDMADVPRITWRKRYHQHELEALEDAGYYVAITVPSVSKGADTVEGEDAGGDQTQKPLFPAETSYGEDGAPKYTSNRQHDTIDDKPVKEVADRESGHEQQEDEPDGTREILEQDRFLRLPGQKRQRAVTVCIDRETMTVLRLAYREREDLLDRSRYDRDMQTHNAILDSQAAMHAQATNEWTQGQQPQIMPHPDPQAAAMGAAVQMPGTHAGLPPPVAPTPPEPPAPPKMVPWHRWPKYDCDTNPQGALGQGIPDDVAGHNLLANKVSTRAVSQSTLNMLPTGIASRQSRFLRGDTQLKLGEIVESPLSPSQVQAGAGMFFVQFPPVDPNWYKVVEMADKSCQDVTAFDIAAGGPGMSGETATESEMRHSNATDNISVIAQRYNRARAQSLMNLAYINSVTLPDDGVVLYRKGQEVRVFRADYEAILSLMEVVFTCDPNLESKAVKAKKADRLFQTVTQAVSAAPGGVPALDPTTSINLIRAAAAMVLKAADAPPEWIQQIMAAPQPQMGPPPGPPQPGGQNGHPGENGGPPGGRAPGPSAQHPPSNPAGAVPQNGNAGPPQ